MSRTSKTNRDFEVDCPLHGITKVSGNYKVESCLRCNSEGKKSNVKIREFKERYFIVECSAHGITKNKADRKVDSCFSCTNGSIASKGALQILEISKKEWGNWDKYDSIIESLG